MDSKMEDVTIICDEEYFIRLWDIVYTCVIRTPAVALRGGCDLCSPPLCNPASDTLRRNVGSAGVIHFSSPRTLCTLFGVGMGSLQGVEVFSERLNAIPRGTVTVAIENYTHSVHIPSPSPYTRILMYICAYICIQSIFLYQR